MTRDTGRYRGAVRGRGAARALLAAVPLAAVTLVAVVPVAVAGPGRSRAAADDGEGHRFRVSGRSVTGTKDSLTAPRLTVGQYTDVAPASGTSTYYRLRRSMPGSTLYGGVSLRPSPDTESGALELQVTTRDGKTCGWGSGTADTAGGLRSLLTAAASSGQSGAFDEECRAAAELVLAVKQSQRSGDLAGTPMEVVVAEEPRVTGDTAGLPGKAPDSLTWAPISASGEGRAVTAGTGFADAPALGPGTYRGSVRPGEILLYKVRLGWGQRMQAQAHVAQPAPELADLLDSSQYLRLQLIGPTRADVHAISVKDVPGSGGTAVLTRQRETDAGVASLEVRYRNRESATDEEKGTAIPGDYYVTVELAPDQDGESYLVPFTLLVSVEGKAGTGAPDYGGAEIRTPAGSGGGAGSGWRTALALAAGGLALIALGGTGFWRLWRSSRTPA